MSDEDPTDGFIRGSQEDYCCNPRFQEYPWWDDFEYIEFFLPWNIDI
ncbi:MAG TPA: hypothetical protein P5246_02330 [Candidatus Omnitrophota bacterium]|jgi:hypothetical protein|nr:hypothetical protein [Candidatus Omnitrophota bacterium]HSA31316.1 hypothetical protein [Candidatus Omnitrophota bacterium]